MQPTVCLVHFSRCCASLVLIRISTCSSRVAEGSCHPIRRFSLLSQQRYVSLIARPPARAAAESPPIVRLVDVRTITCFPLSLWLLLWIHPSSANSPRAGREAPQQKLEFPYFRCAGDGPEGGEVRESRLPAERSDRPALPGHLLPRRGDAYSPLADSRTTV